MPETGTRPGSNRLSGGAAQLDFLCIEAPYDGFHGGNLAWVRFPPSPLIAQNRLYPPGFSVGDDWNL